MPSKNPSLPLAGDVVDAPRELADYQAPVPAERSLRAPGEQVASVGNLLQLAVDKGVTPEALEKLVYLQERVMAKQAEADFTEALLNFQFACPLIGKSREVNAGPYKYKYAELAHIVDVIRPTLREHGLSFAFDSEGDASAIIVICILRHVAGHSTRTRFPAKIDPSSKMNDTQKVASAITYARRYALVLALGLTIGEDDDGRTPPPEHPQPERNEQTPRTAPRGQRFKPTVTVESVTALAKNWKGLIATDDEASDPDGFVKWVVRVCGRQFDPRACEKGSTLLLQWTQDDLAKCHAELRAAEGG